MTDLEFEQIAKLSQEEFSALDSDTQLEYLQMLKDKSKSSSTSLLIPVETYLELGANLGVEVADSITGATDMVGKIVSKQTTDSLSGTQTAVVYLKMTQSVYSIVNGQFKWDLVNTVSLLSSTLACLTAIGINIACMTALTSILASNPFSFALAVVVSAINYFSIGNALAKLKKQYMTCYNSYRRLKKLCVWCDTNELVYTGIKRVIDGAKQKCNNMIDYLKQNEKELNNIMQRKIYIGADFNSFVLFTNVITFIQSAQELSTTRDGVYNDYIDFCSIQDYIDTHNILIQDKCRIEYYILQGDTYGLKNFTIALDYLKGFFATYKLNTNLTKQTKSDIEFVLKCVDQLNNCIGTQNLINLQKENEKFLDSRNPEELFNSIYSYLVYSSSMANSPFSVCSSLLNKEYYKEQDIYEYVSAFSEYPVFLFSKWFFYFGNIMYNDIYIENYKSEIINSYNKDKSLYDFSFYKDLIDNINTFNDYKIVLLWLYSIREFLQNVINKSYEKYSPVYATSLTQTATDKDGKALYNLYTPSNDYLIPSLQQLTENFVKYMKQYGYDTTKYNHLLNDVWLFNNYDKSIKVELLSVNNLPKYNRIFEGLLGSFFNFNNNLDLLFKELETFTYKYDTIKNDFDKFKEIYDNKTTFRVYEKNKANFMSKAILIGTYNITDIYKDTEISLDQLRYLGNSQNINDFYLRLLKQSKDLKYLYLYFLLAYINNVNNKIFMWSEIIYLLSKSDDLRELFFNGYNFEVTSDRNIYLKSLWDYINGLRQDILFFHLDTKEFNITTLINIMLEKSKYKAKLEQIYEDFKSVYKNYYDTINYDIKFITSLINEQIANFETILDKYVKYDSSLSYSYTNKNNTYLWNLYKSARDLGVNNKGYITNIEKNLIPVYKLKDGFIQLETYYPPMFILLSAQDDSNVSQAFYLYNKTAINSLFNIGNEKFSEKVNEFKELVNLSIQPITVDINHNQILEQIKNNIKKSYDLTQEQLTDLIGSQEDEYIIMQNLTNTEILKANNQKVNSSNEQLANSTQKSINSVRTLLDNKKLLKYTIIGGIGVILSKMLGKK